MSATPSLPHLLIISAMMTAVVYGQGASKVSATGAAAALKKTTTSKPVVVAAVTPKVPVPKVSAPVIPRISVPSATGYARYPWKLDIVATVFWVGEMPTENNPTPNHMSSWDTEWMKNFGGFDNPDRASRTDNFTPIGFTPQQNPFYIALPYNDVINHSTHKAEAAKIIPWYKQKFIREGRSVIKGTWLAIRYGSQVCYAQWEDCGPFVTDDSAYVFGNSRPKNTSNNGAGIDISPAVRDYLGLKSMSKCDWRFVDVSEVPAGPWRNWGTNNPFVQRQRVDDAKTKTDIGNRLEELRRMRDEYFQQNGSAAQRNR